MIPNTLKATLDTHYLYYDPAHTHDIGVYQGFQLASDDILQLAQQISKLEVSDNEAPVDVRFCVRDLAPVSETVQAPIAQTLATTSSNIDFNLNLYRLCVQKESASPVDKATWSAFVHEVLRMLYTAVMQSTAERRLRVHFFSGITTDDAITTMQVVRLKAQFRSPNPLIPVHS